jgi:hypothetical protein
MKNTSCKLDFDLKKITIPDSAEEDLYIRSTIDYPATPKVQNKAIFTFLKVETMMKIIKSINSFRPAVLWQKNSFSSHSEEGNLFIARMLTVDIHKECILTNRSYD